MDDLLLRLRHRRANRDPLDMALDAAVAVRRHVLTAIRRLQGEPDREFVRKAMKGVTDIWLATDVAAFERLHRECGSAGLTINRDAGQAALDIERLLAKNGAEGDRMVGALGRVLMAVRSEDRQSVDPQDAVAGLDLALSGAYGLAETTRSALIRETHGMAVRPRRPGVPGLILVGPAGSWKKKAATDVSKALVRAGVLRRAQMLHIPALRFLDDSIASVMLGLSAGGGLLITDLHPLVAGHRPWEGELDAVVDLLRQAYDHPSVLGHRLLVLVARTDQEVSRFLGLHRDLPRLFRPPIRFEMPNDAALARVALPRWPERDPESQKAAREAMGLLRALPGFAGHHSASEFRHRLTGGGITPGRIRAVAAELAPAPDPSAADRVLADIDRMVGLGAVASDLREVVAAARANAARRMAGLPEVGGRPHLLLLGEPGTGKTTVARLVGPLLHAAGALVRPDVVEVGRAELVGEYIGQTAPLVTAAFERARGGVLFIDEAYALDGRSERDFGHEALATLVALMENNHHDTVVVLAGYTVETLAMVALNPGLASRIGRTIHFAELGPEDLVAMFVRLAEDHCIALDPSAVEAVHSVVASDAFAGDGRGVRTLFERAAERLAARCADASLDCLVEPLRLADIGARRVDHHETPPGGYL